jgi:cysteine-rich repeat protein
MRVWLVLALSALGCNQIIGADPPTVEEGSAQNDPSGQALPAPVCGDGVIGWMEECDDGNQTPGDGCDACKIECGPAPEVLDTASGHCFRFSTAGEAKSWDDARTSCTDWGGDLASLNSADELGLVQVRVTADTWIGGRQSGGGFGWSDGEPWSYEPWAPDQPSADGNCVQMDGPSTSFRVAACDQSAAFACERAPAGKLQ